MAYKNETITVQLAEGQNVTGKLNWVKASQYNWKGRDYIDVPYEFLTGRKIPGHDTVSAASFNMVIRKTDNGFEGAVRTTMDSITVEDIAGNKMQKAIQTYQLINGENGNIWVKDGTQQQLKAGYRSNMTAVEFAEKKQQLQAQQKKDGTTTARNAMYCYTYSTTTYSQHCWEQNGDRMDVVCTISRETSYFVDCYQNNIDEEQYPPGEEGGGGGGSYETPPEPVEDPCAEAKAGADSATTLSTNSKFSDAKTEIENATSGDGKEHCVSFGKDANGDITKSTYSTGTGHSAPVPNIENRFADIHNHTNNNPPSSGDLYGFIDMFIANNSYQSRYVLTPNGNVYALIPVDIQASINFNNNYQRVPVQNGEPEFPKELSDEYYTIIEEQKGLYDKSSEEANVIAISYMLSKYNIGVALLKKDAGGNFKRINTKFNPDIPQSENPYSISECP